MSLSGSQGAVVFDTGGAQLPDLVEFEKFVAGMACDIEPLRVEPFPANYRQWYENYSNDPSGVVLMAMNNIKKVGGTEDAGRYAFTIDFIVLAPSYHLEEGHQQGYKFVKGMLDSYDGKGFVFDGTKYSSSTLQAQFLTREDDTFVWVVRVNIRPSLALGR